MNAKEQRRQDWQARIAAYRASGLTMKTWCNANECSVEKLKYWLYKFKRGSSSVTPDPKTSPIQFVPLATVDLPDSVFPNSSLILNIGGARIELQSGFEQKLLREVIHVLTSSYLNFLEISLSSSPVTLPICASRSTDLPPSSSVFGNRKVPSFAAVKFSLYSKKKGLCIYFTENFYGNDSLRKGEATGFAEAGKPLMLTSPYQISYFLLHKQWLQN